MSDWLIALLSVVGFVAVYATVLIGGLWLWDRRDQVRHERAMAELDGAMLKAMDGMIEELKARKRHLDSMWN